MKCNHKMFTFDNPLQGPLYWNGGKLGQNFKEANVLISSCLFSEVKRQ